MRTKKAAKGLRCLFYLRGILKRVVVYYGKAETRIMIHIASKIAADTLKIIKRYKGTLKKT